MKNTSDTKSLATPRTNSRNSTCLSDDNPTPRTAHATATIATPAQQNTLTTPSAHTTKTTPTTQDMPTLDSTKRNLARQKWQIFKRNKRALISLYIFGFLCFVSIFAPLIANHKPILIYHNHSFYFPLFAFYPESAFGGDFESEPDYNDPFVKELLKDSFVLKPLIPYSYDTIILDLDTNSPTPPDSKHLLGSDDQARDVASRLIYGLAISIAFGLVLSVFCVIIGVSVGGACGYYGGLVDLLGQRGIEIYSSVPILFLLIILSSFIVPSFWWILAIVLAFSWISLVGVVRAEFLKARNMEYVKAARALGLSNVRIIFRHLLPNAMVATITYIPFIMAGSISTLVTLDFLGFGMPVGSPSLGEIIEQAKNNLTSPHLAISGFVGVGVLLCVLVFIGEGVRDAFDPRIKEKS